MRYITLIIVSFVCAISSLQAQGDTINTQPMQISLDSLEAHQQAQMDVPYFKWFAYSLFAPGITVLTSELLPVTVDSTKFKDPVQYKKTYKKERSEAAIYGSIIGIIMAFYWGGLIF